MLKELVTVGAYIRRWREDVTARLDRLLPGSEVRFGYPPGRHTIGGPGEEELASLAGTRLPGDLLVWYRQVREVSLPDIGNGYFIHDPGLVARLEVTSLQGRFTRTWSCSPVMAAAPCSRWTR
ncbi:hypothetical protein [Micromonospora sp. NPDC023633]|uniref:hypothetical protein n=1 Tax=Micromonospora sp. NPDC023633 TaxID=3154320 RepID=UPI0034077DD5